MSQGNGRILGWLFGRQPSLKGFFLVSLLPVLLAAALLGYQYFRHEKEQLEAELLHTARALAQAVDRELAATEAALQGLSTAGTLAAGDLAGFHGRAKALLAIYPADNIVLTDTAGGPLLDVKHPLGESLPAFGNPELIRRIVETGSPAVSGLFQGEGTGRPAFACGVPVFQDGKVAYVLVMARFPERIAAILEHQSIPPGWLGVVLDDTATIVARTWQPEKYVGQRAAPGIVRALSERAAGHMHIETVEGVPILGAYSRSGRSGWTVALGIPARDF